MKKIAMAAAAAALALTVGACMQQSTPQQLNTTNANSRIYIGSLTCNIAGGTGYILGSSKSMDCVFLSKDGVQSAQYTGTIDKIGVDNVMIETDYPHTDSTWPNCIEVAHKELAGLSDEVKRKVMQTNASRVFNFVLPEPPATRQ